MKSERSQDPERPNPEELLDRYQLRDSKPGSTGNTAQPDEDASESDTAQPGRGRLRVYLGMAAGVGKTYAMLNEGHRRKSRGTDVVIGYVEAHNRPQTIRQIGDLEIIPRQQVEYHGITLEEMDTEGILERHPAVVLVDELAHTNVPGLGHAKRYEDVLELQAAGITVITTLNIQHLEGLNDIIESITGVRQRETLPDWVLDAADEVELVDIAPDALRARLRHGNVYAPEQAQRALENYFTQSNLTALRELALRRTAEKTEAQLEALMEGDSSSIEIPKGLTATEHVLVAFDKRPLAPHIIRAGWRLARGLKAPLLAVTVVEPGWDKSSDAGTTKLREYIQLAEDLGAEVMAIEGNDIAATIAQVAQDCHITQIVVGRPMRSRWEELFRGSVVNRLLRLAGGADVHIVSNTRERQ
ncbi:MAG: histidine kinase [Chloroflexi bacterium]|nr:MAG: histidine kinase [Chloroflexota bacterium]